MLNWLRRRTPQTRAIVYTQDEMQYLFGTNNVGESGRLDQQHYLFRTAFYQAEHPGQGDYSAPLRAPTAILDVACGTGRWVFEMARRFPHATVCGFDLQPPSFMQHTDLPPNCFLLQGDALQRYPYDDRSFDFTMVRANSAFTPRARWQDRVSEITRVTREGGWIEIRDFDVVISESPAVSQLTRLFTQLAEKLKIYPGVGPHLSHILHQAGLRNVRSLSRHVQHIPRTIGSGSSGGQLMIVDYLALLEKVTDRIVEMRLATKEHWQAQLAQARVETGVNPRSGQTLYKSSVILTSSFGQR